MSYSEQDYKDYGEHLAMCWDEGTPAEALTHLVHDGDMIVVNPYSHTLGNPAEIFGEAAMSAWKAECRKDWAEFAADA